MSKITSAETETYGTISRVELIGSPGPDRPGAKVSHEDEKAASASNGWLSSAIAICLVVLVQGTTSISSSRSRGPTAQDGAANGNGLPKRFEVFPASDLLRGRTGALDLQQFLFQSATQTTTKISPQVLADTAAGKNTSVVILLADQADVSAAYAMTDQDARGWFVYNTLTQHAARSQVGLQKFLKAQGIAYQSFWAANMLVAEGNRSLIESLAARADVAQLNSNRPARWIEESRDCRLATPRRANQTFRILPSGVC